jgi:NAD(P)-dependent dehydrogenase (short-subunit alcohol dehydrogenase family)
MSELVLIVAASCTLDDGCMRLNAVGADSPQTEELVTMNVPGAVALVTGGAGGLGEATVRSLVDAGAKVAILDMDTAKGNQLASDLGVRAIFVETDVTSEEAVTHAVTAAGELGPLRIAVICHGAAGRGTRTVKSDGSPHDFDSFKRTIEVYLSGTFNVLRLAAAAIGTTEPLEDGERGVVVMTASIAGFEGTIGQVAYASAKGGVIGMTLVAARDLAAAGIRVVTIAPGTFLTPAYGKAAEEVEAAWGPLVPFPKRMGRPPEYGNLVVDICRNSYLNGEVIRLDGAIRFSPRDPKR